MNCKDCGQPMKEYVGFNMSSSGEWDCVNAGCEPGASKPSTLGSIHDNEGVRILHYHGKPPAPATPATTIVPDGRESFPSGSWAYVDLGSARAYMDAGVEQLDASDVRKAINRLRGHNNNAFLLTRDSGYHLIDMKASNDHAPDPSIGGHWRYLISIPYTP